jgi:hypothetical protein
MTNEEGYEPRDSRLEITGIAAGASDRGHLGRV